MTGHGDTGGLSDAVFMCPSCMEGHHGCTDLFYEPRFGLLACNCELCDDDGAP